MLHCVALCCNVLYCVAVTVAPGNLVGSGNKMCCSVLQGAAVCCSVSQSQLYWPTSWFLIRRCVVRCSVVQCVAVCCSVLQSQWRYPPALALILRCTGVTVCCNVMQCAAVFCRVLCAVVSCCMVPFVAACSCCME